MYLGRDEGIMIFFFYLNSAFINKHKYSRIIDKIIYGFKYYIATAAIVLLLMCFFFLK